MRPDSRRVVALGLGGVAVVAAGVALALSLPGQEPSPGDQSASYGASSPPTAGAVALSTEPPLATDQPIVTPSASESPASDELATSNAFWSYWTHPILGSLSFDADSLAEATDQADVVVRGSITDLYVGEYWTIDDFTFPLFYAKVEVADLLKGTPHWREEGFIEVQLGRIAEADFQELRGNTPSHDGLWFLMYEPDWAGRGESPMASADIAPYAYFISNEYQGMMRDIDGSVHLVQPEELARVLGPESYPLDLEGASFDAVAEAVAEVAADLP